MLDGCTNLGALDRMQRARDPQAAWAAVESELADLGIEHAFCFAHMPLAARTPYDHLTARTAFGRFFSDADPFR
jgi:hypothetical protein